MEEGQTMFNLALVNSDIRDSLELLKDAINEGNHKQVNAIISKNPSLEKMIASRLITK